MPPKYEWYELTDDAALEQGDLLFEVSVLEMPNIMPQSEVEITEINCEKYDVIILSQSCDLTQRKIENVVLCPYAQLGDYPPSLLSTDILNKIRDGRMTGYHMLNKIDVEGFTSDYIIVDFRKSFSMPLSYIECFVKQNPKRIRLLSPYREHLSQSFARFFMRVGIPDDLSIPRFTKENIMHLKQKRN